ncbi:MAG: AraC family transcriptional regulator [Candidatus Delongbacteria bacterium]|nr:AraC family transcriptional regulator [Candidatus Delongbacteria bacterium]MBN2833779.1 AraC family transcriptional regulator [Candidatus Delongbacteria bacterium]
MNNIEIYIEKINRVLDYIDNNITEELTIEKLSEIAGFSKFHFHRLFSTIMNEPLGKFINRLKIEKSAQILIRENNRSITDIALEMNYSSSAVFNRSFREYFNCTPSEYRDSKKNNTVSKNCKIQSKEQKESSSLNSYFSIVTNKFKKGFKMEKAMLQQTETRTIEKFHLAYVRYIGPYKNDAELFEGLFSKLCAWAGPRELLNQNSKFFTLYHDDPEITDKVNLRISCGVSVPEETETQGEIGLTVVETNKYAVGLFKLPPDGFQEAWDYMMSSYLPNNGYQPSDGVCFEHYLKDPKDDPDGMFTVEICIPIKPM